MAKAEAKPQDVSSDDQLFWSYVSEEERPTTLAHLPGDDDGDQEEEEEEEEEDEEGGSSDAPAESDGDGDEGMDF